MALTPEQIREIRVNAGLSAEIPAPSQAQEQRVIQDRAKSFNTKLAEMERVAKDKKYDKAGKIGKTIGSIFGGDKIGEGVGTLIARNKTKTQDMELADYSSLSPQAIERLKAKGVPVTEEEQRAEIAEGIEGPSAKAIAGDVAQIGLNFVGAGVANKGIKAATFGKGLAQGAKAGAKAGAIIGAGTGGATAMKEDGSVGDIAKGVLKGGAIGAASGAILGGVAGGISGKLKGRALRKEILSGQIKSGQKSLDDITAKQAKTIQLAKTQGIDESDISFISTMKSQDKVKAQKMVELAKKAMTDKRSLERPIDVVGDSLKDRITFIQKTNSSAGKAVDSTAKALKGQLVDATPVRERALTLLEDIGVTANKNGTPNWSKSIFNKNPELQKKIMKTLSDLPAGEIDAYDLHNFKKSIDEVVNYGVGGEGLKGKSANILKAVRNSADEILDSTFDTYNKANTDYKATKEVIDEAQKLFGKKSGFTKEKGGQLLRAVFSNRSSRPDVMKLIEKLDLTSKQYGGKFDDNLIDQALFTEILEDIFGTQATTSLQGQVGRAVKGTQKAIAGLRDPIKGVGDLLATGAEKLAGISDENKRKILEALLR